MINVFKKKEADKPVKPLFPSMPSTNDDIPSISDAKTDFSDEFPMPPPEGAHSDIKLDPKLQVMPQEPSKPHVESMDTFLSNPPHVEEKPVEPILETPPLHDTDPEPYVPEVKHESVAQPVESHDVPKPVETKPQDLSFVRMENFNDLITILQAVEDETKLGSDFLVRLKELHQTAVSNLDILYKELESLESLISQTDTILFER